LKPTWKGGVFGEDPDFLFGDRPLHGVPVLLPEPGHDLIEHLGVQHGALHVFGAGDVAPLEQNDVEPGAGHGDGRRGAGGAGPDHDRVEFFVGHG
jgi:hypothetical protein